MKEETIDRKDRYVLKEHPNGQYWKIIDTVTGKEYSKKSCLDLIKGLYEENIMFKE